MSAPHNSSVGVTVHTSLRSAAEPAHVGQLRWGVATLTSMPDPLEQRSVIMVRQTLARFGATGEIRHLDDSTRTAKEAADALGVEVGQIASSLIFLADGAPVLVVASGGHRVDTDMLSTVLEGATITKANADDVRAATGFAIGGVAPVGHPEPLRTVIDVALSNYEVVWAAGGHPHCVFPTSYDELLRITGGEAAEVGD